MLLPTSVSNIKYKCMFNYELGRPISTLDLCQHRPDLAE